MSRYIVTIPIQVREDDGNFCSALDHPTDRNPIPVPATLEIRIEAKSQHEAVANFGGAISNLASKHRPHQ